MVALCHELRPDFDYVLIDYPAGIELGFQHAVAPADDVLVVTTPEVSAVRDADRVIGLLEAYGKRAPRLIINRLKQDMVRRGDMMDTDDVLEILAISLIGVVPDDEHIVVSTNRGELDVLIPKSRAGQAFLSIAQRLVGEDVPIVLPDTSPGLLDKISRFIRPGPVDYKTRT